ncbi:hypothetical protein [Nonomuraea sp. B1E8]
MPRPPLPPFTTPGAAQKVQLAGDAWNSRVRFQYEWRDEGDRTMFGPRS